jgi:hypothetical protein
MAKNQSRNSGNNSGFPLILSGITLAGLLSALVDATLGWENLAHSILSQAIN